MSMAVITKGELLNLNDYQLKSSIAIYALVGLLKKTGINTVILISSVSFQCDVVPSLIAAP